MIIKCAYNTGVVNLGMFFLAVTIFARNKNIIILQCIIIIPKVTTVYLNKINLVNCTSSKIAAA